jgi:hypothetical protein
MPCMSSIDSRALRPSRGFWDVRVDIGEDRGYRGPPLLVVGVRVGDVSPVRVGDVRWVLWLRLRRLLLESEGQPFHFRRYSR